MRSIFITTIIFFLLTACAAPTADATISATTTTTSTPSFTATPAFSPEQTQQMKALDEMIKNWGVDASEWNYSYNTETGELGIYLAKNAFLGLRGEVKLTLADGSVVDLKSSDVSFDGGDTLNLDGYKLDENGEWVEAVEPVKEYSIGVDAKKFRDYYIPVEDLFDGKDGAVSSVVRYLKSISTESNYDESKLKFVPLERINIHGGTIFYDNDVNPDYLHAETRPYNREYFGYTTDATGMDHFVSFVQYYVKGEKPENYPWIVITSPDSLPAYGQNMVRLYMEEMSFPVILTTKDSSNSKVVGNNPLTSLTFDKYPDIEERFNRFAAGDPTALDGIVLETVVGADSARWFK